MMTDWNVEEAKDIIRNGDRNAFLNGTKVYARAFDVNDVL